MTNFWKDFYKNPIKLTGFLVLVMSIFLFVKYHFHQPDFYTDRALAETIAEAADPHGVNEAVKHLLNPAYPLGNTSFHLWGGIFAMFIFVCVFQIKRWGNFFRIKIFYNKIFIYSWINFYYIISGLLDLSLLYSDLMNNVYNSRADSFGIPLMDFAFGFVFFGVIYYTLINLLAFLTLRKQDDLTLNIISRIGWGIAALVLLFTTFAEIWSRFSYLHIAVYLLSITYFFFAISAFLYKEKKPQQI